jgi:hypothetical protein
MLLEAGALPTAFNASEEVEAVIADWVTPA